MSRALPERRRGPPAAPELAKLRGLVGAASDRYPLHGEVTNRQQDIGGVRCVVLEPARVEGQILYFHGGGFRMGSPLIAAGFASRIAAAARCRVVLPFYSLAPEHPFPCALLDGEAVLDSLARDCPLLVAGDSAGGNLAAVLGRGHAREIAGVFLLSPWLDLRVTARSYHCNAASDGLFSRQAAGEAARLYLQGHSASDPDVSPLLGELRGMPEVLIATGSGEVLLDDSLAFARELAGHQRGVSLHVLAGMKHVAATLEPRGRDTDTVVRLVTNFVREVLGGVGATSQAASPRGQGCGDITSD